MTSVSTILLSGPEWEALVNEVAATIEKHVAGKGGVTGMAMKLGYKTLKAAKPDITLRATRSLLPEVVRALEPLHAEFETQGGGDFGSHLRSHAKRASALVMTAMDERLALANNPTAMALYQRFRAVAAEDLQHFLPRLGKALTARRR